MNLRGRNKVSAEFNMSSMTDIVFLLLIFFMLTSTMVTTNALDLVLPKAKGKTDNNKSISISIDKDKKYYIDKQAITENEIEAKLLSVLGNGNKSVILRVAEGVPIEKAVYVMDIANRNQIKIVLAVRPK
ncbi:MULTISPECIES: ExbD/TolR family protein [Flavobacterium]|uniref:Biopolymer transporter ExbD n=2 Tax=Flavobacterium TaxID=237 RepID=A0AA94JNK0_9FLAO|nr:MULTISPECIES: biopolymer transporter ExbD [Flavobacterium]OXA74627.1 biopolymer transporter ExbD [Flavobacterium columnare NBRC 100251 = ATCC 23463]AMA49052.1 biopolymer transporter ExbD [Flavobacterium covae]AND64874.1 biopolymer transporter ExbD [Flavobacterium covae]MCH4830982.1 biopolymer transporter ExbD [Flavobacterium columnare]MCH4833077.1 biopolymer transporter ExbD [Flavobacterium columnare]